MQNSPLKCAGAAAGAAPPEGDSGRKRRRYAAAVAACVAVLGLFGAGCTDSSDGKSATGSEASDSSKTGTEVAYRKCLRDHGLDVPDPKPGEESQALTVNGDKETADKAFKACKDKAPDGGTGDGEASQADKDEQLKLIRCMRKEGVDLPDPEPNTDGGVEALQEPTGAAEKKKFDKAYKACAGDSQ